MEANFIADSTLCRGKDGAQFLNLSENAKSYKWYFGDGDSSNLADPLHYYPGQGTYTVSLIIESCYTGDFDTMTKQDYILVDSVRDICNAILMPAGSWVVGSACETFIYDHGGEEMYSDRLRDTLTLVYDKADSAYLTFLEFSYETDWDSIYVYDAYSPGTNLIGGFTGPNLPNAGNPIKLTSGAVTITHFSDQFVVDDGFKAKLETFRPDLQLSLDDDKLVCYNQLVTLTAYGSGGDRSDYYYLWNGTSDDSTINFYATKDTMIYLLFGDRCTGESILDSVQILVRDPLQIDSIEDVTLCYLEELVVTASATGGNPLGYEFTWLPFNLQSDSIHIQLTSDSQFTVQVYDYCSENPVSTSFNVFVRNPIELDYLNDTLICQGTSVDIVINAKGGLDSFDFFHNDGNSDGTSNSTIRTISPVGSGAHTYYTYVTDYCTGTMDTAVYQVRVRDSVGISVSADTTICFGTSAEVRVSPIGGDGSYSYDWIGLSSASTVTVTPAESRYFVVQVSDDCSIYEPKDSVYVTVLDSISVEIIGPDSVCYTEQFELTAQVSGGTGQYSYNWDQGEDFDSRYSLSLLQSKTIPLTISDGCTVPDGYDEFYMPIRDRLQIELMVDSIICFGESTLATVKGSGGIPSQYEFRWEPDIDFGTSKLLSPMASQPFSVFLHDQCSDETRRDFFITVNPLPVMNVNITGAACTDEELDFSCSTVGNQSFNWNFGDGNSAFSASTTHSYENAGLFNVRLIVTTTEGCIDSLDIQQEIVERPIADFSFTPDQLNFLKAQIQLENLSSFADAYTWEFGDGGFSVVENPNYRYADTGWYAITLIAENSTERCSDTASKSVYVAESVVIWIPNSFSPNGDVINDGFKPYIRGLQEYHLQIYDRWGQLIWESRDPSESWDGTFQGELVQNDAYLYILTGLDIHGNEIEEFDNIYILR